MFRLGEKPESDDPLRGTGRGLFPLLFVLARAPFSLSCMGYVSHLSCSKLYFKLQPLWHLSYVMGSIEPYLI